MLSWKVGKNVCKLSARIIGIGVFPLFLRSRQTRCGVVVVHVPGCVMVLWILRR